MSVMKAKEGLDLRRPESALSCNGRVEMNKSSLGCQTLKSSKAVALNKMKRKTQLGSSNIEEDETVLRG